MDLIVVPVLDENKHPRTLTDMMADVEKDANREDEPWFAFEGEPALNGCSNILLIKAAKYRIVPFVVTAVPRIQNVSIYMNSLINVFNETYPDGEGELILHIASTSEKERKKILGSVLGLVEISKLFEKYPRMKKRKAILMLDQGKQCDADKLGKLFSPEIFSVRLEDGEFPEDTLEELKGEGYEIC